MTHPGRALDEHNALVSLCEELTAIDVYNQRYNAGSDPDLMRVIDHARTEEKEHAASLIAWLAANDPVFREKLTSTLSTDLSAGPWNTASTLLPSGSSRKAA